MEAYSSFAEVYDTFMDNVPYEEWCEYITGILRDHGISDGLLLDLGCGTGKMTRLLRDQGYDMIGVDLSEDMLGIAREQDAENILYLQQDMREFELYGTVRAVVSVCDCMNYILEEEDLLEVFKLVNNYLDPGGIFLFDVNTRFKYEELIGDQTICEHREDASFVWDNIFDEESGINEYELTLFIRHPEQKELFQRFQEYHYQRAYALEMLQRLLEEAGMKVLAVYEEGTRQCPSKEAERVYFVAMEQGKTCVSDNKK